jgi:hypothetical protein
MWGYSHFTNPIFKSETQKKQKRVWGSRHGFVGFVKPLKSKPKSANPDFLGCVMPLRRG